MSANWVMNMSVAVGVGLMELPFSGAKDYWRWVDLCEAGGVDSLWQTDRLLSREPMLECMTAMAALAGRTRRIKFGMNVVSLALRDPVLVAKQCATIDVLSEGRLLPAFGIGSPRAPEWAALHVDTRTRHRVASPGGKRGDRPILASAGCLGTVRTLRATRAAGLWGRDQAGGSVVGDRCIGCGPSARRGLPPALWGPPGGGRAAGRSLRMAFD